MAEVLTPEQEEDYALALVRLNDLPEFNILQKILRGQVELRRSKLPSIIITEEDKQLYNSLMAEIMGLETAINYPKAIETRMNIKREMRQLYKEKEGLDNDS